MRALGIAFVQPELQRGERNAQGVVHALVGVARPEERVARVDDRRAPRPTFALVLAVGTRPSQQPALEAQATVSAFLAGMAPESEYRISYDRDTKMIGRSNGPIRKPRDMPKVTMMSIAAAISDMPKIDADR